MIVKIPIYFEIDSKFPPDQVSELTEVMQKEFTSHLMTMMRKSAVIRFLERDIKTTLLSKDQVIRKISGSPSQPAKVKKPWDL